MKLTVLIADDESMPRIILRDHLPWDDFFVGKVILASDGQEALELANTHQLAASPSTREASFTRIL